MYKKLKLYIKINKCFNLNIDNNLLYLSKSYKETKIILKYLNNFNKKKYYEYILHLANDFNQTKLILLLIIIV